MDALERITIDPAVMGGKPCIRGLRVTVGTVISLLAAGHGWEEVLRLYPYLEEEDIRQALAYAAWIVERAGGFQVEGGQCAGCELGDYCLGSSDPDSASPLWLEDLRREFAAWDAASDEALGFIDDSLGS